MKTIRIEAYAVTVKDDRGLDDIDYVEELNDKYFSPADSVEKSNYDECYYQQYRIFPTEEMARTSIKQGECYFGIQKVFIEIPQEENQPST